jgi:hypothetical protein
MHGTSRRLRLGFDHLKMEGFDMPVSPYLDAIHGAMAEAEQKNMDMPEEEHKRRNLEWLERTGQIFASDNFMEHEDQHWDLTY